MAGTESRAAAPRRIAVSHADVELRQQQREIEEARYREDEARRAAQEAAPLRLPGNRAERRALAKRLGGAIVTASTTSAAVEARAVDPQPPPPPPAQPAIPPGHEVVDSEILSELLADWQQHHPIPSKRRRSTR